MGDHKRAERATGRKARSSGCLVLRRSNLLLPTAGRMGFVSPLFHASGSASGRERIVVVDARIQDAGFRNNVQAGGCEVSRRCSRWVFARSSVRVSTVNHGVVKVSTRSGWDERTEGAELGLVSGHEVSLGLGLSSKNLGTGMGPQ